MSVHKPVLLKETIENLNLSAGIVVFDGTLGGGGHGREIIQNITPDGKFIGADVDEKALLAAKTTLKQLAIELNVETHFVKENFRNLKEILGVVGVKEVDALLVDLGFSSDQIDESGRGFSFQKDEPLLMTLSGDTNYTATDFVNSSSEEEIFEALRDYGEEPFARQIADGIVKARREVPITTTFELVDVIKRATPDWYSHKKIHPATRSFQAIRVAVNDELGALRDFLSQVPKVATSGGRLAVITFHSLEDRIVKFQFMAWERSGVAKRVNKKVIKAGREEQVANRRSRSAKLRVCEFI